MFSSINLFGSPKGTNGTKKDLEFTPIGKGVTVNTQSQGDFDDNKSPLGPSNKLNYGKVVNKDRMESSFDHTADHFSATINSMYNSPYHPSTTMQKELKPVDREPIIPQSNQLLSGGVVSIKQQQQEFNRLETENYNLKIKLATLSRYFDKTPDDQKQILNQNIDLKQQLMEYSREIDRLHRDMSEKNSNKEQDLQQELDTMRLQLKQILKEKDSMLDQQEDRLQKLQESLAQSQSQANHIPDDLLDRLEFLQSDNQSLRRNLDQTLDDNNKFQSSNSKLSGDINALAQDLEEKDIQIDELQREVNRWKDRYEVLNDEYRGFSNSKQDNMTSAKEEIIDLKSKLDEMDYKYHAMKSQLERSQKEFKQSMTNQYGDKHNVESLTHKLELMSHELKMKDREESNLRAQISALINDKSKESNYNAYSAQIDSLTKNEARLSELNRQLNSDVTHLKDQLYDLQYNSQSQKHDSKILSLQKDNNKLKEKLAYYEEEYSTVETALRNAESDTSILQAKLSKLTSDYHELEQDNIAMTNELKELSRNNNSALSELEQLHKKRLEAENQQLSNQVDSLHFDIKQLQKELDIAKLDTGSDHLNIEIKKLRQELDSERTNTHDELNYEIKQLRKDLQLEKERNLNNNFRQYLQPNNDRFFEGEYHKLSFEKDQLQIMLDENTSKVKHLEMKIKKFQLIINDKENTIDDLETKLREMNRANKFSHLGNDDEKAELFRTKTNYESKLRMLELEKDGLKRDFDLQNQQLHDQINVLTRQLEKSLSSHHDNPASSIVALLENQLEEAYKSKNEASKSLREKSASESELKAKVEISTNEINQLTEKINTLLNNETILKQENQLLDTQVTNITQQLNDTRNHCNQLVSKITDLRSKASVDGNLKLNNDYLQDKINDLSSKFAETDLNTNPNTNQTTRSLFYESQIKYYRAKLYDLNLKANDLQLMYGFTMNSIRNNKDFYKNGLLELSKSGILSDQDNKGLQEKNTNSKISFALVAKFVLAMVKIKRRYERSEKRKRSIFELKNDIEKKKIILLE